MARPLKAEEFAELTDLPLEVVKSLQAARILDYEGDELFDENDAAKLWFVRPLLEEGRSIEEINAAIGAGDAEKSIPFIGKDLDRRPARDRPRLRPLGRRGRRGKAGAKR